MNLEGRARLRQRLQRHVRAAGRHVVQHCVAVAERAALDILAGQADADAVAENRGERQLLGRCPIDRSLVDGVEHPDALFAAPLELLVDGKVRRHCQERCVQLAQPLERDGRVRLRGRARRWRFGLWLHEILFRAQRVVSGLHLHRPRLEDRLGLVGRDDPALDEARRPDLPDRGVPADLLIHQGLGKRRFVALIVAVSTVADEIDQEVALESLAVGEGQPRRLDARFWIVGIHMDDRNLEAAREPACIRRAVDVLGPGREPQLVVDDHVDRAAGRVAGQATQVERLGDDTLARECRVAVDQDRHAAGGIELRRARAVDTRPRRARHALDNRIDRLEMARIGRHRHDQVHRRATLDRAMRAGVVLDVAGPRHVLAEAAGDRILELGEDLGVRLVQHVRHDIQPAAMCHPDENLPDAGLAGPGNDFVEDRHEHVEPLDREARLARKCPLKKALERLDLGQPVEQLDWIDRIGGGTEAATLGRLPQPFTLVRDKHMRVVVAGRRAIDAAEQLNGVVGRRDALERAGDEIRRNTPGIVVGYAVCRRKERGITDRRTAPGRIEPRGQVSVPANHSARLTAPTATSSRGIDPVPAAGASSWSDGVHRSKSARASESTRRRVLAVSLVPLENIPAIKPGELLPT